MRKGFTLVEIMIVVMIIGMLLAIAVPQWMKARQNARTTVCEENRRVIDDVKQLWAQDKGKATNDTPAMSDLDPYYLKGTPVCPESGTYTLNTVGAQCECSVHGVTP